MLYRTLLCQWGQFKYGVYFNVNIKALLNFPFVITIVM